MKKHRQPRGLSIAEEGASLRQEIRRPPSVKNSKPQDRISARTSELAQKPGYQTDMVHDKRARE